MRRSRHLAAAFLLLFIFGAQNVSTRNVPVSERKNPKPGCHRFIGRVACKNGEQILSQAAVTVQTYDPFTRDDELSTAKIGHDGTYKIEGCAEDGFLGYGPAEIFLEFKDVCFVGQRYQTPRPKPNAFEYHELPSQIRLGMDDSRVLKRDEFFNSREIPSGYFDYQKYQPMRRPHPRPQPQPIQPHFRPNLQPLMDIGAGPSYDKRNHAKTYPKGTYTFKGKVQCRNDPQHKQVTPIRKTAVVKLWEYDMIDSDDFVAAAEIEPNGHFTVGGKYIYDRALPNVELYLEFVNVCWPGDSYEFRRPHDKRFNDLWLGADSDAFIPGQNQNDLDY